MQIRNNQLFTIVGETRGHILTNAGGVFDTASYSRFKYGDTHVADRYGQLLTGLILACQGFQDAKQNPDRVVLTASAYKTLPTAAQAVVDSSVRTLHSYGYPVAGDGRIHRAHLTDGDYGTMNAIDRAYWMSQNGLWAEKAKFSGRDVIVIDDISITGAHAASVARLLETMSVKSITLVHVLKLAPELAFRDPTIEDRMNHRAIKSLTDLGLLIKRRPDWIPNARAVKFVLTQPSGEVLQFLECLPAHLPGQILAGIRADGYDSMPRYHEAARYIEQLVEGHSNMTYPSLLKAAS